VPDGKGGYQIDHTANIVIINPRGHYHGFIRLPHDAEKIATAYRSLAASF
jgi:protein SCO1/2